VRHCLQQSDERCRCGNDYALFDAEFDQTWILLERRAEKCLARQKHEDKFRSPRKLFPVSLSAELRQVSSDLTRVVFELCNPRFIIGCLQRLKVCLQRSFRVYDYVSVERQPDDHVRSQSAVFTGDARLLVEIAVVLHACDLYYSLQLD